MRANIQDTPRATTGFNACREAAIVRRTPIRKITEGKMTVQFERPISPDHVIDATDDSDMAVEATVQPT